jgi:NAD(P)-dependent dehydrogenase (short-subunit alcohol dehydrogenase family)
MPDRAAIVTGASRGIGRALAEALANEGFGLTITARKPSPLEETALMLRATGVEVEYLAANMADEQGIRDVVTLHREHFGRLDVLVNNAGVGIGAAADEQQTKFVDLQLAVNVRAIVLFYREAIPLLKTAAEQTGQSHVINLSSYSGKSGQPWLSVYSATKAAVIGYTEAMSKELASAHIKSTALCPGFVDTDMSEFVKGQLPADQMIRPQDIAEGVRFVLRLSTGCTIPEIAFTRPGETGGLV